MPRSDAYSWKEADDVFREALKNRGVDLFRRNTLWAAVRVGGAGGWSQDDLRQSTSDADVEFVTSPS